MAKNGDVIKSSSERQTLAPMNTHAPTGQDYPRLLNRELGILAFNERVLAMAEDLEVPLL